MPPLSAPKKPKPMPKFKPAAPEAVAIFESAIDGHPGLEKRKMFGYPCAFVQGQMLFGVFADRLVLRLADADRAAFLKLPGAEVFEPTPGRTMREYVEIPPAIMNTGDELQEWLQRGIAYVQTLPPKVKKSSKAIRTPKTGASVKPKASATIKPKTTAKQSASVSRTPTAKPAPKAATKTGAKIGAKPGTKKKGAAK